MNSGSAIRNTNHILLLVSFGISLILGGLYIGGDQTVYIKVYETIGSFVIVEAFLSGFAIDVNSKSKIKFSDSTNINDFDSLILEDSQKKLNYRFKSCNEALDRFILESKAI